MTECTHQWTINLIGKALNKLLFKTSPEISSYHLHKMHDKHYYHPFLPPPVKKYNFLLVAVHFLHILQINREKAGTFRAVQFPPCARLVLLSLAVRISRIIQKKQVEISPDGEFPYFSGVSRSESMASLPSDGGNIDQKSTTCRWNITEMSQQCEGVSIKCYMLYHSRHKRTSFSLIL